MYQCKVPRKNFLKYLMLYVSVQNTKVRVTLCVIHSRPPLVRASLILAHQLHEKIQLKWNRVETHTHHATICWLLLSVHKTVHKVLKRPQKCLSICFLKLFCTKEAIKHGYYSCVFRLAIWEQKAADYIFPGQQEAQSCVIPVSGAGWFTIYGTNEPEAQLKDYSMIILVCSVG